MRKSPLDPIAAAAFAAFCAAMTACGSPTDSQLHPLTATIAATAPASPTPTPTVAGTGLASGWYTGNFDSAGNDCIVLVVDGTNPKGTVHLHLTGNVDPVTGSVDPATHITQFSAGGGVIATSGIYSEDSNRRWHLQLSGGVSGDFNQVSGPAEGC
jgi:hypothetical protein